MEKAEAKAKESLLLLTNLLSSIPKVMQRERARIKGKVSTKEVARAPSNLTLITFTVRDATKLIVA